MSLAHSAVICMNEPPVDELRCFMVFLLRPTKKFGEEWVQAK
jgi:hypothetical protein